MVTKLNTSRVNTKEYIAHRYKRIQDTFYHQGTIKTIKGITIRGFYKPIESYLNFLLKSKNYPQHIIFIAGLTKSGSTWIQNMFSSLDGFDKFGPLKWHPSYSKKWSDTGNDLYPNIFSEFRHKLSIVKGHTWGKPSNIAILKDSGLKYIITVRDPRDKIISEYWFIRNYSPYHWNYKLASNKSLSEYITYKLECGEFEKESIEWIRMWLENRDIEKSVIIKYEEMLNDTYSIMKNTLDFLEIDINDAEIKRIVETNSFKKITGRSRGEEDRKSFYRKGISNEWKEVFSDYQKNIFINIGEDVITQLGYEPTA